MRVMRWLAVLVLLVWGVGSVGAQEPDDTPPAWTVVSTLDTDIRTGGQGHTVYLAPNGKRLAHLAGDTLCLYALPLSQEQCIEFADLRRIDPGSVRWSPDSRYLTFSQNFFVFFVPSSIWLVDTSSGTVRPLTEVAEGSIRFGDDDWPDIDLLPGWTPAGDLLFMRLIRAADDATLLYRFADVADDQPALVGALHELGLGATYVLAVADDQIAFNVDLPAEPDQHGVWVWSLDGDESRLIYPTEGQLRVMALTFSPDGHELLVIDHRAYYGMAGFEPENSSVNILDVASGELRLIDPTRYVTGGGWSPDGSAFAYLVQEPDGEDNGLYITSEAGTPGELVLAGDFYPPDATWQQPLTWTQNNTLLLGNRETSTALIVELAQE